MQLRTSFQDAWANAVEANARVIAPGLKFGGGPEKMREYFVALAEMLASLEQGRQVDAELIIRLDGLKFGTDYEAAQAAYAEAELANGDVDATLDIVLLSADSLETIEQTHSSYFGGDSKKLEELLPR